MKRFLALLLAILMVLCVFSACGSNDKETEAQNEEQGEEQGEEQSESQKAEDSDESEKNSEESEKQEGNKDPANDDGDGENIPREPAKPVYTREEKKITFGSYPQSKVTDESLINTLNGKAGFLPTSTDSRGWKSYGYYISSSVNDFMWYIDVEEGNERYRGVYFTSYRPYITAYGSSQSNAKEGYEAGTTYWFKYEPITWTILDENKADGTALVLCDLIIDSQAYQNVYIYTGSSDVTLSGAPTGTKVNNYAYSTIRDWLNDNFYNTAFNVHEKVIICDTTVDNSAKTATSATNPYACSDTEDKIFLASYEDIVNGDYGFSTDKNAYDTARQKKYTDYALSQGLYECPPLAQNYAEFSVWWLRTPTDTNHDKVLRVDYYGANSDGGDSEYVHDTRGGVVPALQIKL